MGTRVVSEKSGDSYTSREDYMHGPRADRSGTSNQHDRDRKGQTDQLKKFAGLGIGLSSVLSECVMSHPCVVMRRQCQVNSTGSWYHTTPFTVFQIMLNMGRNQGITTYWKGISSTFIVKGVFLVSETVISEFTPFPKEINRHSSIKKIGEHLILKGIAYLVTTPFYAASLLETVQSDIASERPGVFDCLKEGVSRVVGVGLPQTNRLLPIWQLILPTVVFRLSHYIITSIAQYSVISAMKVEQEEHRSDHDEAPSSRTIYETYFPELLASFSGNLLADMMLYPLETVMNRLYFQGTRTIIDNTDTGLGVLPINTRFEGPIECCRSIISEEGLSGLYRGFGVLILQYAVHAFILRISKFLFKKISEDDRFNGGDLR